MQKSIKIKIALGTLTSTIIAIGFANIPIVNKAILSHESAASIKNVETKAMHDYKKAENDKLLVIATNQDIELKISEATKLVANSKLLSTATNQEFKVTSTFDKANSDTCSMMTAEEEKEITNREKDFVADRYNYDIKTYSNNLDNSLKIKWGYNYTEFNHSLFGLPNMHGNLVLKKSNATTDTVSTVQEMTILNIVKTDNNIQVTAKIVRKSNSPYANYPNSYRDCIVQTTFTQGKFKDTGVLVLNTIGSDYPEKTFSIEKKSESEKNTNLNNTDIDDIMNAIEKLYCTKDARIIKYITSIPYSYSEDGENSDYTVLCDYESTLGEKSCMCFTANHSSNKWEAEQLVELVKILPSK